ncbi:hypothetical protein HXX76_014728 [Chlamydomonas incerta]|uniref:Uncharacterized protein n=1 Tax=Chlamydomonas incerta TaxID=51695 RepID=A0A835VQN1_CHLIN|nr:hypothetical protein HXX76_014728 [Chlamydomonas incerta]|eukprot:KAG2424195.1 hypothetical protein HXX76_014728 [Chlamydomonas incerta]
MSKRGAAERDYAATQSNLRRARVEVRRVDAIQILMAAARARSGQASQSPQVPQPQPATAAATTTTSTGAAAQPQPQQPATAAAGTSAALPLPQPAAAVGATAAAPCTHCGAVLPVSAEACRLRQCSGCYDVFCSLCSVPDYEEREDRVFCFSCLDEQTAASRRGGQLSATPRAGGGNGSAAGGGGGSLAFASLSMSMALPSGGAATGGRWGQLDSLLGVGAAGGRSPFPCSATRTPQHGAAPGGSAAGGGAGGAGGGGRTPGSAMYGGRSHRGFSALLAFGGAGS